MGSGDGAGTGSGAASGDGSGSGSGGVVFQVIWLILLILVSYFVAGFCAGWYIILLPFTVCIEPLSAVTDILLRGTQLTYFCAKNMMDANTFGEAFSNIGTSFPPPPQIAA